MKRYIYFLIGLLLTYFILFSAVASGASGDPQKAEVKNVHFTVENGNVMIIYDLLGPVASDYKVRVILKKDSDTSYQYEPHILTGDIGTGKFAGTNRQIVWALSQEFPGGLAGKDYYFIVQAEEIGRKKSSHLVEWIGIGLAAVAATATYIVTQGQSHNNNTPSAASFPSPPERPK